MSSGERDAYSSLLSSLIYAVMFYLRISGQYEAGLFDGPDALQIWARSILWLILFGIGIAIAVTILFTILYVIVTGEKKPSDLKDERDWSIEVRGTRIATVIISIGLVAAIMDLAWGGASAIRALSIILIGCSVSEMIKSLFKIYRYRRGF